MIHLPILALYKSFINCLSVNVTYFLTFFPLFIYLLSHLLSDLSTSSRIDPFLFQVGGRRRRSNVALVFCVLTSCCSIFCSGCMFAFVAFGFSVLSQEIGSEERLGNDYLVSGGM